MFRIKPEMPLLLFDSSSAGDLVKFSPTRMDFLRSIFCFHLDRVKKDFSWKS